MLANADDNLLEASALSATLFAFDRQGWNYSHHLARDAPSHHTFQAYVLSRQASSQGYRVCAVVASPSFRLVSRRRGAASAATTTTTTAAHSPTQAPANEPALSRADDDDDDNDDDDAAAAPSSGLSTFMSNVQWLMDQVPSWPLNATDAPGRSVLSSLLQLREPLFKLEAIEHARKRPPEPEIAYASFLADMPVELDTVVESFANVSLHAPPPSPAMPRADDAFFFIVRTMDELEELLPLGVNLKLLLANPVQGDDAADFPNIEGRWEIPDEVFSCDLNASPYMNGFAKSAAGKLLLAMADKTVAGRRMSSGALEVDLPRGMFSARTVRACADGSEQAFRVTGPLSTGFFTFVLQVWCVGPVAVVRFRYGEDVRVDRCVWRRDDGRLALLFVYQSVGGLGWSREVFDRRTALIGGEWVVNRVTCAWLAPAPAP